MKNIALHILDLVENSVRAEAQKVLVTITEDPASDSYLLVIEDNGKGMNQEIVQKATDPFYTSRTTRKVGLGLPLIQQNAERTGGTFLLRSEQGVGTRLEAKFVNSHPDRLPLGEIDDVLVLLAIGYPRLKMIYEHKTPLGCYIFNTEEIGRIIGNMADCNQEIRKFLREMIIENLNDIGVESV